MILPPSWSMSVPRNVTLVLVGRALHVATSSSSASATYARALALEQLVGAVEVHERDGRLPVLRVLAAGRAGAARIAVRDVAVEVDVADRRRARSVVGAAVASAAPGGADSPGPCASPTQRRPAARPRSPSLTTICARVGRAFHVGDACSRPGR